MFAESFLHYIWKHRLFNPSQLVTVEGEEITVINPGTHNTNAGPDFQNARIKIGSTEWAGSVEIHINGKDYFRHKHQEDDAYLNVILHVVYNADKLLDHVQTLELKGRIPNRLVQKYKALTTVSHKIACESSIGLVDGMYVSSWVQRVAVERMEKKVEQYKHILSESENDWDYLLLVLLARAFGSNLNAQPFEMLIRRLDKGKLVKKHTADLMQLEAILFGMAGLLHDPRGNNEAYRNELAEEFVHIQHKHNLKEMDYTIWKFMRTRPSNFPTARLAQLCAVIHSDVLSLSMVVEADVDTIISSWDQITLQSYWVAHYNFGSSRKKKLKNHFSDQLIQTVMINAIAPFLFLYGSATDQDEMMTKALQVLEQIPAENNAIIREYESLGISTQNALDSQGLLGMYKDYCSQKKCVNCTIGNRILQAE